MWEIDISQQLLFFGRSIILGIIYCLLYDILRALRRTVKYSDIAVSFQDIVYFLIISPVTFLYLLAATNGEPRFYIILGIGLGFIISYYSLSKVTVKIFGYCFKAVLGLFSAVFSCISGVFLKSYRFLGSNFKKCVNFFKKTLKKQ